MLRDEVCGKCSTLYPCKFVFELLPVDCVITKSDLTKQRRWVDAAWQAYPEQAGASRLHKPTERRPVRRSSRSRHHPHSNYEFYGQKAISKPPGAAVKSRCKLLTNGCRNLERAPSQFCALESPGGGCASPRRAPDSSSPQRLSQQGELATRPRPRKTAWAMFGRGGALGKWARGGRELELAHQRSMLQKATLMEPVGTASVPS